ncbi:MAG: RHS repeat-associated core domain-containing protein [Acidobacteriota bacterium]
MKTLRAFFLLPVLLSGPVPASVLGDVTNDGRVSTRDLVRLVEHVRRDSLLTPVAEHRADVNRSGHADWSDVAIVAELVVGHRPLEEFRSLPTVFHSSPAPNEEGVALTRELVVAFSAPVAGDIDWATAVQVKAGGESLSVRPHLTANRRTLLVFPESTWPASRRLQVTIDGEAILDDTGQPVDADANGLAGGTATFDFDTLAIATVPGTALCGRVFASELEPGELGGSISRPLPGVTIRVDGDPSLTAVTDAFGSFRLAPAPAGRFFVHVDGSTASVEGLPLGAYYPNVGKPFETVAGRETKAPEIFLPLVAAGTLTELSLTEDTVISFPPSVLAANPQLAGTQVIVPPGALLTEDGSPGRVGIAPVPPDRLPGPLPEEVRPPLVITVQADGGSNFDEPVGACAPNLPDPVTGEVAPPDSTGNLVGFNHDTGRWEIEAATRVTPDGVLNCTEPGQGISAPGWWWWSSVGVRWATECRVYHGSYPFDPNSRDADENDDEEEDEPDDEEKEPGREQAGCQGAGEPGDPVHLFSGEFYLDVVDLHLRGRGMDFEWRRSYRSRIHGRTSMGDNWKHGYDIWLGAGGGNLVLADGSWRRETFTPSGANEWEAETLSRVIQRNPDFSYTLSFGDGKKWQFGPIDLRTGRGLLRSMEDRNGNTITFHHDADGRLETIVDTLGRQVDLVYEQGFLTRLNVRGTNRYVDYGHETVPGTGGKGRYLTFVNRSGRTTRYRYDQQARSARLRDNLLEIENGRRQVVLRNVFSSVTDERDPAFDRTLRQFEGGGVIDYRYDYAPLPERPDRFRIAATTVNDAAGNVRSFRFDEQNQKVAELRYLEKAPSIAEPSFGQTNMPEGEIALTSWSYRDGLPAQIHQAGGGRTTNDFIGALDPTASQTLHHFLRARTQVVNLEGGELTEEFEYDEGLGSCCGLEHVTRHVNARGHETTSEFDDFGNIRWTVHRDPAAREDFEHDGDLLRARIHPEDEQGRRRRDEYHPDANGFPQRVVIDVGGLELTTTHQNDAFGNPEVTTSPNGDRHEVDFNAFDEIEEERWIDADGTLVARKKLDRDQDSNVEKETVWEIVEGETLEQWVTTFTHDAWGRMTGKTLEVGPTGRDVTITYHRDGNGNVTKTVFGEGTELELRYDGRDLLVEQVRAPGRPEQSTTRYVRDVRGNVIEEHRGVEDGAKVWRTEHDLLDRVVREIGPVGTVTEHVLDGNGNRERTTVKSADGTLLSEVVREFDPMDRLQRQDVAHFDADGASIGDGVSTHFWQYAPDGSLDSETDDLGHVTDYEYDSAGRRTAVVDARGNRTELTLDDNGNALVITETEWSDLDEEAAPPHVTEQEFDMFNRVVMTTDPGGIVERFVHDSRGLLMRSVDGKGNVTRHDHDGLGRRVATTIELRERGVGSGELVDSIVTRQEWDRNSRLVARVDDGGNRTEYEHDGLDRVVTVRYADRTERTTVHDAHDNAVTIIDANGTVTTQVFDDLNRLESKTYDLGAGVSDDLTWERYSYDDLSRLVLAEDDDSVVEWEHDSLGNVVEERRDGHVVTATHDGLGRLHELTQPNGRVLAHERDALGRLERLLTDGDELARFHWLGGRLEGRDLANGTQVHYGHDASRRIESVLHSRVADGDALEHRSFTWDAADNKTSRRDLRSGGLQQTLGYDSARRMVRSERQWGALPELVVDWHVDGVQNWETVTAGPLAGSYAAKGAAGRQVSAYESTPQGLRDQDDNGNTVVRGLDQGEAVQELTYDARNQVVELRQDDIGLLVLYRHDALGRRIEKEVRRTGEAPVVTELVHYGERVVEEHEGGLVTSLVHGVGLDDIVSMRRAGQDWWFHGDDQWNVLALSDATGVVRERYDYQDYGLPSFFAADGALLSESQVGNHYLFNGRRWDQESGLYHYRTRYLDPLAGRFLTRDVVGIWADPINLGNGYAYVGNNPWSHVDPMGEGALGIAAGFLRGVGSSAIDALVGGAKFLFKLATQVRSTITGILKSIANLGKTLARGDFKSAARMLFPDIYKAVFCRAYMGDEAYGMVLGRIAVDYGLGLLTGGAGALAVIKRLRSMSRGLPDVPQVGRKTSPRTAKDGTRSDLDETRSCSLTPETLVLTPLGAVQIVEIVVGDRVLTPWPEDDTVGPQWPSEAPQDAEEAASWGRVVLEVVDPRRPGDLYELDIIRPKAWLEALGLDRLGHVTLEQPVVNVLGEAEVKWVGECPAPAPGPGSVVTSTIRHWARSLVELRFAGVAEAMHATASHPFLSVTRGRWVAASELVIGEELRADGGRLVVESLESAGWRVRVVDLEVADGRAFLATELGIAAHNCLVIYDEATGQYIQARGTASRGIYEFPDQTAGGTPYVGQSGNLSRRLRQHERSGRLQRGTEATRSVTGDKTDRELAEHGRVQELTGGVPARDSPDVANRVDPIGPSRQHLLEEQ